MQFQESKENELPPKQLSIWTLYVIKKDLYLFPVAPVFLPQQL